MAENSKIAWTDDTINLWWGCQEVSDECDSCYARVFATRVGKGRAWRDIRYEVPSAFKTLDKLQRKAAKAGEPRTVFIQSMSDIFELSQQLVTWHGRFTGRGTADVRDIFFDGVTEGKWPDLVFLLLTKRPGLIRETVPESWLADWPPNVWTGTSVGTVRSRPQIERLGTVPGRHFVSFEPLLEPILPFIWAWIEPIDWAIIGVESKGQNVGRLGPGETEESWSESAFRLVDRLSSAKIPVFVKQFPVGGKVSHDPAEWDERLRLREFPQWMATEKI